MNTTDKSSKLVTATRAAAGAVLVVAFLGSAACGSGGNGGKPGASTATSPVASQSATPGPTPAPSDQDSQLAVQILDAVVRGDFNAATAHFDSRLQGELPPDQLGAAWATYQATFGRYQSHGVPQQVPVRDLTVVSVPFQMERTPGEFQVSFWRDGSVASLIFLRTGVRHS